MTTWHERLTIAKTSPQRAEFQLMAIAAEAENTDPQVFALAYDAATRPDERADFIAEIEELFAEQVWDEHHAEARRTYEARTGKDWDNCEALRVASYPDVMPSELVA